MAQSSQGTFTNGVQVTPPMRCVLRGKLNVNIALIGNTEGHSLSGIGVDQNGQFQNLSLSENSEVICTDRLYRPIPLEEENQQLQQAIQGQSRQTTNR